MKCEICGKEALPEVRFWDRGLCEAHYIQVGKHVREYVESLKPEVTVDRCRNGYAVSEGIVTSHGGSSKSEGFVTEAAANALCDFIKRERGANA